MIDGQLRPQGIFHEKLLRAIAAVDRELFLPLKQRPMAYSDRDVPITSSRHLLKVLTFARLMQSALLEVADARDLLIIGEPSLYGAAVAQRLGLSVTLLDGDIDRLKQHESALELSRVHFHQGHLLGGCLPHAPYDIILLAGFVPRAQSLRDLTKQLTAHGVVVGLQREAIGCSLFVQRGAEEAFARMTNIDAPPLAMAHSHAAFAS